jgi:hypothetical protein
VVLGCSPSHLSRGVLFTFLSLVMLYRSAGPAPLCAFVSFDTQGALMAPHATPAPAGLPLRPAPRRVRYQVPARLSLRAGLPAVAKRTYTT